MSRGPHSQRLPTWSGDQSTAKHRQLQNISLTGEQVHGCSTATPSDTVKEAADEISDCATSDPGPFASGERI